MRRILVRLQGAAAGAYHDMCRQLELEVMQDSGVRTGMDIFSAHALGASGVLLGRAVFYALTSPGHFSNTQLIRREYDSLSN
jgi:isopentenyl diphosphate isomerase/L-lactate dehydrogenase-like FMN-dependent dehydrogenase